MVYSEQTPYLSTIRIWSSTGEDRFFYHFDMGKNSQPSSNS